MLLALYLLQVVGQPCKHLCQAPGTLAGLDQCAIQTRERRPLARQAAGQAQAFGERPTQGHQHTVQGRLAQLAFKASQRVDQGDASPDKGRQLAGQFTELGTA